MRFLWSKKDDVLREDNGKKGIGGSSPRAKTAKRLSENVFTQTDNPDAGTEFDDIFFQQIGNTQDVDLPQQTLLKAQRLAHFLYRKNCRAWSGTEILKDFALGDGVKHQATDPKVQAVLDNHWEINEWDDKIEERMRALSLSGEQIYPTFVNDNTGLVKLSTISPFKIKNITRDPKNAENQEFIITSLKAYQKTKIINIDDDGKLEGETFYFAVNRVSGGTRGVPDMLPSVDWLEGLDGMLFSLMERSSLAQDIVFDLTYEGANDKECREMALEFIQSLKAGGAYAHNEKVKLEIKAPELAASDAETVISILLRQIQSGMRLAGLFFGDAEDLTKGSASELSMPVAKAIKARQNFWKRLLTKIFKYQIQQSKAHGQLEGVTDFGFKISMAPILLRDVKVITDSLISLGTTLAEATEEHYISNKEAAEIYRGALEQLGSLMDDFDPEDFKDIVELKKRFVKKDKGEDDKSE
jgi:hypothetical protein